jgi:hypothetical protein
VQRPAAGEAFNLLVTTETIGDDQRVRSCAAHGREQDALADLDGDIILAGFKSERASHAAAAGIKDLKVDARAFQQFKFRIKFED